jgi:uncharacterized protein YbbK (DUF523 family)
MKLVSACLLGVQCNWDGRANINREVIRLVNADVVIPVCPEQLGGLRTPRAPQEIQGGGGNDVLDGRGRVVNSDGEDVTKAFLRGAKETLKIATLLRVTEFIGKAKSPSCGCGKIYDGSFSGMVIRGDGVTSALLKRHGVTVVAEDALSSEGR